MTIDLPSQGTSAEGTSLPPPRPFGEPNTLTLSRARTGGGESAVVAPGGALPAHGLQPLHVAIVPASAASLTITF